MRDLDRLLRCRRNATDKSVAGCHSTVGPNLIEVESLFVLHAVAVKHNDNFELRGRQPDMPECVT